jgi:hypothetical protein
MCPDRPCEGISQKRRASREAGLYNGKIVWRDKPDMLGYALESDCRTSFLLFWQTRYERASELNVRG